MKKTKNTKTQKVTPGRRAIQIICIILAILMAAGGIYYLVQFFMNLG